ncbi:inner membrane protein YhjD [Pseudonocardia hispaniensis]|uniref:Inner membrane protein YhjD n=1 Tax=Pseudonocardia hispaniensis TaxID=904933 RepID=A0ABW1IWC5_9PSEU
MAVDQKTAGSEIDDTGPGRVERLRARHPWLDHIGRAAERYQKRHGDHYAAAITYFSVLALVPLLMIAFSAAAFVLRAQPGLLQQLQAGITEAAPGPLGDTLNGIVNTAISQAGAVGALGLLGALYSGIGWMSNLREALSEQWAQVEQPSNVAKKLVLDLAALVGLGISLVVALAVTAVGTGLGRTLLDLVGLGEQGWARFLLGVAGVVLGLVANWLVFLWVIARLPRAPVSARSAVKAALLGAIGFEILKQIMAVYLRAVAASPAGVAFGSIIGLLIFAFFVSRFLLFVTAWAATARENEPPQPAPVPGPAVIRPEVAAYSGPDGRTAAGLLGVGAVLGLLGMRFLGDTTRRR